MKNNKSRFNSYAISEMFIPVCFMNIEVFIFEFLSGMGEGAYSEGGGGRGELGRAKRTPPPYLFQENVMVGL